MESGIGPEKSQPTKIKFVSFFRFPIDVRRGPPNSLLYDKSRICNSDKNDMSEDSTPFNPMLDNVMEVTRELVHRMPTQLLPHGSEPTQLGGVFFQTSFRAFNWLKSSGLVEAATTQIQMKETSRNTKEAEPILFVDQSPKSYLCSSIFYLLSCFPT
uniref:Putative leucine-rich repeat receptor-like protein kinase At5g49770 isoform X1 n=1 Tax=Rhizophora mucronata TaxID=61149 RepID=A0A2P2MND7_RHIMU